MKSRWTIDIALTLNVRFDVKGQISIFLYVVSIQRLEDISLRSVVSCHGHWSVVSIQWSVVSGQWPVVSYTFAILLVRLVSIYISRYYIQCWLTVMSLNDLGSKVNCSTGQRSSSLNTRNLFVRNDVPEQTHTFTKYIVHCTVYSVHCTLCTAHCTLYSVHCTM